MSLRPMNARHGKMARLPRAIRLEIGRRLLDGYSHKAILKWLNADASVAAAIEREMQANWTPKITADNLCGWINSDPIELRGSASLS